MSGSRTEAREWPERSPARERTEGRPGQDLAEEGDKKGPKAKGGSSPCFLFLVRFGRRCEHLLLQPSPFLRFALLPPAPLNGSPDIGGRGRTRAGLRSSSLSDPPAPSRAWWTPAPRPPEACPRLPARSIPVVSRKWDDEEEEEEKVDEKGLKSVDTVPNLKPAFGCHK